jgi:hypothetical protein
MRDEMDAGGERSRGKAKLDARGEEVVSDLRIRAELRLGAAEVFAVLGKVGQNPSCSGSVTRSPESTGT